MTTTTTKPTTPTFVKHGSPEADFVLRFERYMINVWILLDDSGFLNYPHMKADWHEMKQYWDNRPFFRYLPPQDDYYEDEPLSKPLPRRPPGLFRRVFYALFG